MREILFRGKRLDNGEWLDGNLLFDEVSGVAAIVTYINLSGGIQDLSETNVFQVVPETIGEYTGLTDKNGIRIFEGDIVRNSIGAVYVIKWDMESLAFVFSCFKCETEKEEPRPFVVTYEVIGNIHDNPELIEDR